MSILNLLAQSPTTLIILCGIIGLLVGSFLNVVIYRLPVMMFREWRTECLNYLSQHTSADEEAALHAAALAAQASDAEKQTVFNLMLPLSRCPKCQSAIKAWQNIPVVSYVFLGGKCAKCKNPISARYPAIEALTGILSAITAWHIGFDASLPWALLLTWVLISLSFIDVDQQLLPDSITLPLLWLGLLLSLFGIFCPSQDSLIGAMAGYLSLWSVYQLFKLVTGKEGMGFGDFKLLAMLGAWLGWQSLPAIILLSSLVGALLGTAMIIFAKKDHAVPIPFGPYLAIAGWIALLWGKQINALYLSSVGL